VAATTPAARAAVEQSIEDYAAITARAIKLTTQYVWPLTTSAGRDAHCAGSYAALAPIPYAFGIPSRR
jgi:hypothetical protein